MTAYPVHPLVTALDTWTARGLRIVPTPAGGVAVAPRTAMTAEDRTLVRQWLPALHAWSAGRPWFAFCSAEAAIVVVPAETEDLVAAWWAAQRTWATGPPARAAEPSRGQWWAGRALVRESFFPPWRGTEASIAD